MEGSKNFKTENIVLENITEKPPLNKMYSSVLRVVNKKIRMGQRCYCIHGNEFG